MSVISVVVVIGIVVVARVTNDVASIMGCVTVTGLIMMTIWPIVWWIMMYHVLRRHGVQTRWRNLKHLGRADQLALGATKSESDISLRNCHTNTVNDTIQKM